MDQYNDTYSRLMNADTFSNQDYGIGIKAASPSKKHKRSASQAVGSNATKKKDQSLSSKGYIVSYFPQSSVNL